MPRVRDRVDPVVVQAKSAFGTLRGVARPESGEWRLVRLARRIASEIRSVRLVEASLVLAAQAFLALIPMIIVVYALAPVDVANAIAAMLRDRFGVSGGSETAVTTLLAARSDLQRGLSAASVVFVVASATAFTRALQRVYERAWGLSTLGLRGSWRWLVWLGGLVAYLSVIGLALRFSSDLPATGTLLGLSGFVLWWWTPWLLLGARVHWRALLPTAAITTAAMAALGGVSGVVVPRMVRGNEQEFGPIGVVFAVESWLVVVAGALVAGAAVGALLGGARVDDSTAAEDSAAADDGAEQPVVPGAPAAVGQRADEANEPDRGEQEAHERPGGGAPHG
jgi:membrane protein